MKKDIKFSIVIPAYNTGKYIHKTLDSVYSQTYSNYEVVIVNDGSTDSTSEIIRNYFKNFPAVHYKLIEQKNKGIGAARNSGIRETQGDFVAFLDADDKWSREKLSKIKRFLEENPQADLVCHDECCIRNGSTKKLIYGPHKTYKDLLFGRNCLSTSATVVRRAKLFEAGLFSENTDFNGVEDYELWLRLSKICRMEYLHQVLGEYALHDDSISSNIVNHTKNTLNVVDFHFKQWGSQKLYYKLLMIKRRMRVVAGAMYRSCKAGRLDILVRVLATVLPRVLKR